MSKTTHFTSVTALPPGITRASVLETLHSHGELIDLQPQVIERHPCKAPSWASAEEYHCSWYSITDKISYLPGVKGKVTYHGCFNDLEDGLQTHIYAPMGLEMKNRWTVGGNEPGEPRVRTELGLGLPKDGLWLREDVEIKCSLLLTSFVKSNMKKAHTRLVDRLIEKAHRVEADSYNIRLHNSVLGSVRHPSIGPASPLRHQSTSSGSEPKSPRSPGWMPYTAMSAHMDDQNGPPSLPPLPSYTPLSQVSHPHEPHQSAPHHSHALSFSSSSQGSATEPSRYQYNQSYDYHQQQQQQQQQQQSHQGQQQNHNYPPPPPPLPQQYQFPPLPPGSHSQQLSPLNQLTFNPVPSPSPTPYVVKQPDGKYIQYVPMEYNPARGPSATGASFPAAELPGSTPSAFALSAASNQPGVCHPPIGGQVTPASSPLDSHSKPNLAKRQSGVSGVLSMTSESNESTSTGTSSVPPLAPPKVPIASATKNATAAAKGHPLAPPALRVGGKSL